MSDDGTTGLTLIAFIGSVFSPYYAWARRRARSQGRRADPMNHCAFNVALYAKRANRWTMTERGRAHVDRDESQLSIGASRMRWTGEALEVHIDEACAPVPHRMRGTVRVTPASMFDRTFLLDAPGRHRWMPLAPCAHIEVAFSEPDVRWSGNGYFDANCGDEPLEDAFVNWTWSRAGTPNRTVLYDVMTRGREARSLALRFSASNRIEQLEAPPSVDLPSTRWGISRRTRADSAGAARVIETLENAPFYSRSVLDTRLLGVRAPAMHESLDLDRFGSRWVQCLLPFRMPRSLL